MVRSAASADAPWVIETAAGNDGSPLLGRTTRLVSSMSGAESALSSAEEDGFYWGGVVDARPRYGLLVASIPQMNRADLALGWVYALAIGGRIRLGAVVAGGDPVLGYGDRDAAGGVGVGRGAAAAGHAEQGGWDCRAVQGSRCRNPALGRPGTRDLIDAGDRHGRDFVEPVWGDEERPRACPAAGRFRTRPTAVLALRGGVRPRLLPEVPALRPVPAGADPRAYSHRGEASDDRRHRRPGRRQGDAIQLAEATRKARIARGFPLNPRPPVADGQARRDNQEARGFAITPAVRSCAR
jgi:hypothetical protein